MEMRRLKIGEKQTLTKKFDHNLVAEFAKISGDINPIHINEAYASKTRFGRCIVHGGLVSSMFSNIIANELPGPGSIFISQSLQFLLPVFVGDTVTSSVQIIKIREDKPIITLSTLCENSDFNVALKGEAVVLYTKI